MPGHSGQWAKFRQIDITPIKKPRGGEGESSLQDPPGPPETKLAAPAPGAQCSSYMVEKQGHHTFPRGLRQF
jgi:hypothetical protein